MKRLLIAFAAFATLMTSAMAQRDRGSTDLSSKTRTGLLFVSSD